MALIKYTSDSNLTSSRWDRIISASSLIPIIFQVVFSAMSNTNIDEHSITNNNERYVTADDLTVCDDSDERDDDVEVVAVVEDGDR